LLKGIDEIQTYLDDHIVKTQAIRSSPFCKPFEQDVLKWESTLLYIQDLMDQCVALQRSWMSLEPIFLSEDIKRPVAGYVIMAKSSLKNVLWKYQFHSLSLSNHKTLLARHSFPNLSDNFPMKAKPLPKSTTISVCV